MSAYELRAWWLLSPDFAGEKIGKWHIVGDDDKTLCRRRPKQSAGEDTAEVPSAFNLSHIYDPDEVCRTCLTRALRAARCVQLMAQREADALYEMHSGGTQADRVDVEVRRRGAS